MSKYWFRKRRGFFSKDLGWGWIPISWEGWLVVIGCVGVIVAASFSLDLFSGHTTFFQGLVFGAAVIAVLTFGAWVSHMKVRP